MELKNCIEKIDEYLKKCSGRVIDVFYELYQIIATLEPNEQAIAVRHILEGVREINTDESCEAKCHFNQSQISRINQKFQKKQINENIRKMTIVFSINALDTNTYFEKVWEYILASTSKNPRERALAIFALSNCDLLPYRPIGVGLSMDEEEYRNILTGIDPQLIENVDYIFKLEYSQKTQVSSLLLDWLLSLNDKKAQVVFMAVILNNLKRTTKNSFLNAIKNI